MQYDIQNYTETQIKTALDAANIDTAIELWKAKDWQTYSQVRWAVMALLRAGRSDEVSLQQMQFIYFINTHLRFRYSDCVADWKIFTSDLPACRSIPDQAWAVATRGEFWHQKM